MPLAAPSPRHRPPVFDLPRTSLPSSPDAPRPAAAGGPRPAELAIYRGMAALAAVATPIFGWIHHAAYPGAIDPAWQRALLTVLCGGVILATYLFPRHAVPVVYTAFYGYTAWVLQLFVRNGLYPDYAIGAMVVVAAVSGGFPRHTHLRWYLGATLAAVLVAVVLVTPGERLHISGFLYVSYLALFCALAYVTLRGRLVAEHRLAASRTRYALAARGASDGLWDWDVARERVYYSPRWKEIVGCADHEVGAEPEEWLGRIHPDDRARVEAELFRSGEPTG
ncbi:MAG TPA: PAS domain-containing protein, partial [Longimicrobiaceae bacterium]|nr:PAS domain-containing protein [Longimicrobiaceae bacterium]